MPLTNHVSSLDAALAGIFHTSHSPDAAARDGGKHPSLTLRVTFGGGRLPKNLAEQGIFGGDAVSCERHPK